MTCDRAEQRTNSASEAIKGLYRKSFASLFGTAGENLVRTYRAQGRIPRLEVGGKALDDIKLPPSIQSFITGLSSQILIERVICTPSSVSITIASLLLRETPDEMFFIPFSQGNQAIGRTVYLDINSGRYYLPTRKADNPLVSLREGEEIYRIGVISDRIPTNVLQELPTLVQIINEMSGSKMVVYQKADLLKE